MTPGDVRGRFLWHELLTTDPDAASRFYGAVAGWETIRWEQDSSYRLLATDGVPVAGLLSLTPEDQARGAAAHWLTYVGVPDVDAAVRLAAEMGATVRSAAQDVPSVGRMAEMADPQGTAFAVYTPAGEQVRSETPTLGDFSWHELATTNWQAAWEFYSKLFGWQYESSFDMGPAGTYWMFRLPGQKRAIGGMYTKQPDQPGPAQWLPYILVASADLASEAATHAGGTIVNGPQDVPGGDRVATASDPQNAAFAVHSLRPAPARKPPARKAAKARKRAAPPARKKARARPAKRSARKAAKKIPRKVRTKAKPKRTRPKGRRRR
jgi:predicted enzyme related to lactoylglutathione lyase